MNPNILEHNTAIAKILDDRKGEWFWGLFPFSVPSQAFVEVSNMNLDVYVFINGVSRQIMHNMAYQWNAICE